MNGTREDDIMILSKLAHRLEPTGLRARLVFDAEPVNLHLANPYYVTQSGKELLFGNLHVLRGLGAHELLRWSAGDILGPVSDLDGAVAKIHTSLAIGAAA
ncbi:hypothetical protein [Actinomadura napierensis]|uniref:hypothetical protein n=1 Tax=Actinomadura napierensis TaxID=267854 RepID=UPI0031DD5294